ncbi:hypothetical protein AX14_006443 [Amanita brunnescens Koide BX004]|nr:hypothetical protein AX14_006443 [Amanita brunnescens Koide BX004]
MALIDHITDVIAKFTPSKQSSSMSGNGHGIVPFDDDNMIVSKPTIAFHSFQIFFNFLAMACFASVAAFQAKWGVGPSGLSSFALFVSIAGILLSAFMLTVPVIYEKYDKLARTARALKEERIAFIFTGVGVTFSLLIAFITTISAWTEPGCKNPANDPHAKANGVIFQGDLPGWCNTKKAGAIFFWLAFAFWTASLGLLIYYWRTGRLNASRDPTFVPPRINDDDDPFDEDSTHLSIPAPRSTSTVVPVAESGVYDNSNQISSPFADPHRHSSMTAYSGYPATTSAGPPPGRPSLDAYGAFSDPAPSGFINPSGFTAEPTPSSPPSLPIPDLGPRVSRTMQYADPYAAVRVSLAGPGSPPSYESYSGYR